MARAAENMNIPAPGIPVPPLAAGSGPVLLGAGWYRMGTDLSAAVHRVPSWLFELFRTGRLEVRAGSAGWREFPAGSAALYAPEMPFRERLARGCRECTSLAVFFDDGGYAPFRDRFASSAVAVRVEDPDGVLADLVRNIETGLDPGPGADLLLRGSLDQLLSALVRGQLDGDVLTVRRGRSAEPEYVAAAHRYMRLHLAEPIRLADLAAHVGFSESGFAHAYRRATGRAPMTALRAMRIEAAKFLLCRDQSTLQGIAEQTGFADAFHLSRAFKHAVGASPRAFRRTGWT